MQTKMINGVLHVKLPLMPNRGGWVPAPALVPANGPERFKVRSMGKRPPLRAVARAQAARWGVPR